MPDDHDPTEAFGYRPAMAHAAIGTQAAEGKDPETLEPVVFVFLRFASDPGPGGLVKADEDGRLAVTLHPDLADGLADELHRWANRAREKHYE